MTTGLKLYSYWRSSASYRVRIALNLKGLEHEIVPVNIAPGSDEQKDPTHRARNPQMLVPVLADGDRLFTQSMAIIEYLDEAYAGPALLPGGARERARMRAIAQAIACEIQPLVNLGTLARLARAFDATESQRNAWVASAIADGLTAVETMLADNPQTGVFCQGETPTVADVFLVPQCFTARRFGVDLAAMPTVARIDARCRALPAFARAAPELQVDAPRA